MKHFVGILSLSPVVILLSLFLATPALAFPPFPSSFYGTVKVNGNNAPDGTVVQALVGGQVYAEGHTQTYQGDSFFALDIAGDDPNTAVLEGGRDGDTIQFKIGALVADQTATWHGGTNVVLNLTATSSTQASTRNGKEERSGNISLAVVVVIVLPTITAIGCTFLALRKKRM